MLTEIEVEGIGTMRQLNVWQLSRLKAMKGPNREVAWVAFGLGLTIQQFKKLSPELQHAARQAHHRLYEPAPIPTRRPAEAAAPRKHERMSIERQAAIGRRLLAIKEQLPRGHFRPWIEEKSGISYTQAARCMKLARRDAADIEAAPAERVAA